MAQLPVQAFAPGSIPAAQPFPPDLHDARHLWLKAGLLALWALVSFVACYFARDMSVVQIGGWPLGYWIAAQGAVLVFIAIVVAYCLAMSHFERRDARRSANDADVGSPASHG